MSHVHLQTCNPPGCESSHESLPSVSRWHDTEAPICTPSPKAKPLSLYSDPFNPEFRIEELLLHQNRNFLPDAVSHHVNNNNNNLVKPGQALTQFMPPSPSTHVLAPSFFPNSYSGAHLAQPDRYEDLLDRIEEQQEDLRDARDDLVGSRFRLRSKRQELRATRRAAATQMGAAFDLVKRYLLQKGLDLPGNIETSILDADNLRDGLGILEIEYEEDEEKYDLEEWSYTETEKAFINGLPGSTPLPVSPPAPTIRGTDRAGATQFSSGPPDLWNVPAPPMDSIPHRAALGPTGLGGQEDVVDLVQEPENHDPSTPRQHPPISMSQRALFVPGVDHIIRPLSRPYSESDLGQARLKWSDTRKRIDGWLLNTLKCSKFQQGQLRGLVHSSDLSDDAWWQLVVKNWSSEGLDEAGFHTGDTTISGATASEQASINTMNMLFGTSDAVEIEAKDSSVTPLLPADRIVDALEVTDIPATIEPRDLEDIFSKDTPLVDTPLVIPTSSPPSTAPSIMTRTSSIDDITMAIIEDNSSCTSSEDGETVCRGEQTDTVRSLPGGQDDSARVETSTDSCSHTPFAQRSPLMSEQESLHEPVDDAPMTHLPDATVEYPPSSPVRPYSTESEGGLSARTTQSASVPSLHRPPSPPKTRSCSPGAERQRQRQCPVAPFIRINSPTPWNFPLLRLTPSSKPTPCTDAHRLEYLPFVSLSDSPFRLPGPFKLPEILSDEMYD